MKLKSFLFTALLLISGFSFSQGCSDAGFCTVDAFKNPDTDSSETYSNLFKVGVAVGKADYNIGIFSSFLEYKRSFGDHWSADVKLTHLSQVLDTLAQHRLADAFITGGYTINESFSVTAGVKIPFTDGNLQRNNQALPLDFQPSLGTVDFLAGVSWEHKRFRFTAALQQPITQNKNTFLSTAYDTLSVLNDFQSTNGFERKGDVLVRGVYQHPLGKKWTISPGILAIAHLGEDSFIDANGQRLAISGSSGLTLNGTIFALYAITERQKLEFTVGSPFIVRAARPDGLTRSFVMGLEYRLTF